MHQWMERQRKKWEVTLRGKAKKEREGRVAGARDKKRKGARSKMEEGEWVGETGRRLCMGKEGEENTKEG